MFGRWQRCCDGDRTVICNDEVNSLTTPEQHNKYLAYTHIGYGAFSAVIMILVMIMFGLISAFDQGGPPAFFFFFIGTALFLVLFSWVGGFRRAWPVALISVLGAFVLLVIFMRVAYISLPLGVGPFQQLSVTLLRLIGV